MAGIHDFAGIEVASMKHIPAGMNRLDWAGEASDHTNLVNGACVGRITRNAHLSRHGIPEDVSSNWDLRRDAILVRNAVEDGEG